MGIMTGHEEQWLRMMLEDEKMMESFGLPTGMSAEEKDHVIAMMLSDTNFMAEVSRQDEEATESFKDIFSEKDEDESPCDWMVREACNEMGIDRSVASFTIGSKINGHDLVVGSFYQITFPNHKTAKVRLARIFGNSFGDDYVFENIEGAESLTNMTNSTLIKTNEFPLPEQLLDVTVFHNLSRD